MLKFLLRGAIFVVFAVITIELFFRFGLRACEGALSIQEPQYKLMIFDAAKQRDGVYTIGRFTFPRPVWHVNNYGWLAHNDYEPPSDKRKPVIAVIGDSYVEGYHVPEGCHVADVIREQLGGTYDVYRFGTSGAPLSHYLQSARYARDKFDPAAFVIIVQERDLSDAVANIRRDKSKVQMRYEKGSFIELPITLNYRPKPIKRLLRNVSVLRYLMLNRRYTFFEDFGLNEIRAAMHPGKKSRQIVKDPELLAGAAREIVAKLAAEHPGKPILFVVDGDRRTLRDTKISQSLPEVEYLRSAISSNNERIVDMAPVFTTSFRKDGKAFNFREDYHWNVHGHRVVGETVANSLRENFIIQ